MAMIYRGADSKAFAAMTTEGFEFSRDIAKENGMDLGIVVLGDQKTNPPAAIVLDIPPGGRLPRHSHNTNRMEMVVRGSIITPDGEELCPGDVSVSAPGEEYGPLIAGEEGCLTIEIFADLQGLAPQAAESESAEHAEKIAAITERHTTNLTR